jgi:hypothetical protein
MAQFKMLPQYLVDVRKPTKNFSQYSGPPGPDLNLGHLEFESTMSNYCTRYSLFCSKNVRQRSSMNYLVNNNSRLLKSTY